MDVLITGGTGFLGTTVTEEVLKAGHTTYVLTRDDKKALALKEYGIQPIIGDLLVDGDWQKKVNEMDLIIHLASPSLGDKKISKKVANVFSSGQLTLTKKLFDAVHKTGKTKIVVVGHTNYFGDTGNAEAKDESYRAASKGWGSYIEPLVKYVHTKVSEGYHAVVAHPGQVYAPTAWTEQQYLLPIFTRKPLTSLKGSNPYYSLIHIEDCARALLHLGLKGEAGEHYIVADTKPVQANVFRSEILKLMGVDHPQYKEVSRFAYQMLAGPVMTEVATMHTNLTSIKLQQTGFEYNYPTYKDGLPNVVYNWLQKQVYRTAHK